MYVTQVPAQISDSMQTSTSEEQMQMLGVGKSALLHVVKSEITHKRPFPSDNPKTDANNLETILRYDIPVVYKLQCRNKCEQQSQTQLKI
jgi:hypothetical protein